MITVQELVAKGGPWERCEVIGDAVLFHGDAREVLPLLPPCDLVFTSPPYNMNLRIRNGEYCSRQIVDEFSTKYEGYADNLPIDDYEAFATKERRLICACRLK